MWNPFRRRKRDPEAGLIDVGGIEPGLDKWGKQYRKQRIAEIAEMTDKSLADATVLADKWFIRTVEHSHGLPGGGMSEYQIGYVPTPVWDDEWAFRKMFDTREDALAHIESKRGELLVPEN